LEVGQLALQPRHQIVGRLQSALFVNHVDLNFGRALLRGLAFPPNMIDLLLQGTAVGHFPVQRSLDGDGLSTCLGRLGLGSSELVA
jgi:hypothetical protein